MFCSCSATLALVWSYIGQCNCSEMLAAGQLIIQVHRLQHIIYDIYNEPVFFKV